MKILVLGGSGMLGHKLVQVWKDKFDVWTTLRGNFDNYKNLNTFEKDKTFENISAENHEDIEKIINDIKPEVIVNAIGVIKQLPTANDIIKTLTINSIFPHRLSEIAGKVNARLICISTDCVFGGEKGNYNEKDVPDAYDLYGKSKNLGEVTARNCLTIRTSIIGREIKTSHSLVEWFLSNQGKKIKGYKEAVFSGFPTIILADILADLIVNHKNLNGLYHVSSEAINKLELLELIKKEYQVRVEIEPSSDLKIDRSLDSTKFRKATGFKPLSWGKMIKVMANDPTPYDEWRK
jgi:dTDP-4-dehydrorhamnose reductase